MLKVILIGLICFGAFVLLGAYLPSSTHTAFTVSGHAIPWIALGVCGCAFLGYKAIK
jgi:hypothetical protein